MRNHVFILAFALAANACFGASPEDAKLESFFRHYLDERFAMHPTEATSLGDHRFDNKMDDISPAALNISGNPSLSSSTISPAASEKLCS